MKMTNNQKRTILEVIILTLIFIALLRDCKRSEPIIADNRIQYHKEDSVNKHYAILVKENIKLKAKTDSLSNVKPKVVIRYRTVYDSLIVADTTCVRSLYVLNLQFMKVNITNDLLIEGLNERLVNDSVIQSDLIYKISLKQDRINNDSLALPGLLKKSLRKGRKQGIFIGAGIVGGVILGVKLLVK